MTDYRRNEKGNMLAGVVVGSLVGAGLALLMAPKAGYETRRRLSETARKLGGRMRSLANNAGDDLSDGLSEVKDRVTQGVNEVKKDAWNGLEAPRTTNRT
ncbi:MAG: YtxH domain-containing protein [Candidatus Eisenbacteria bacterium]|nr:YtxH domain-containing protein [Candidatus Eisenbacteria bacterium]